MVGTGATALDAEWAVVYDMAGVFAGRPRQCTAAVWAVAGASVAALVVAAAHDVVVVVVDCIDAPAVAVYWAVSPFD